MAQLLGNIPLEVSSAEPDASLPAADGVLWQASAAASNLQEFLSRYPVDQRAQDYLAASPPAVVARAINEFRPPREGEDDYSGLLTAFVKRLRHQQTVGHAPLGGWQSQAPWHHSPASSHPNGWAPGGCTTDPAAAAPVAHGTGTGCGSIADPQLRRAMEDFTRRYPIDGNAYDYLMTSPHSVLLRVVKEFQPPREGENDYSALLTTFVKKCRTDSRSAYMGVPQQPAPRWSSCGSCGGCNGWNGPPAPRATLAAPTPTLEAFATRYPID